jgi:beta-glucanase (GH16 family)
MPLSPRWNLWTLTRWLAWASLSTFVLATTVAQPDFDTDSGNSDGTTSSMPSRSEEQATPKDYPGYTLVWHDEFEQDGRPDPANWTFETGFVRNQELQWYQPENCWCENGFLIIEARREQKPNPHYRPGSTDWKRDRPNIEYTSANLNTQGLHSWKYGRFEMRARIDIDNGLWPAFWTKGVAGRWPDCGEIDIMEFYRSMLLANVGWGSDEAGKAKWSTVKKPIADFGGHEWSKKFHVWRMDWDPDNLNLYVDGQLMNSVNLANTVNPDDGTNPFHQPEFILLNLAIGGTSGGDPAQTKFPRRYMIDYIRVYQKSAATDDVDTNP